MSILAIEHRGNFGRGEKLAPVKTIRGDGRDLVEIGIPKREEGFGSDARIYAEPEQPDGVMVHIYAPNMYSYRGHLRGEEINRNPIVNRKLRFVQD